MPPKRKSARQGGRSAAKITKTVAPSLNVLTKISVAQKTTESVNISDLTRVVTLAVTEALKAVVVGKTMPLARPYPPTPLPPTVNGSPTSADASATVETTTVARSNTSQVY